MIKIGRRISIKTRQYITVSVICILAAAITAFVISYKIISDIKTESENQISAFREEMESNKRTVLITTKDIMAGEVLTKECLETKHVYATQPQETYISETDIGKVVLIDIMAQTQVLQSMITDTLVSDEVREAEYNTIIVSSNILNNDTVDLRIAYPNGEDYVVLSKKILKGYEDMINCHFWLNEEEIIRMRNAIVDAYIYTGSFLYTTKYIEPNLQEPSVVTYTPSVEAINLIQQNPNIIKTATNDLSELVRQALENRLAKSLNKNVSTEQWDLINDDVYQQYDGKEINTDKQGPASEQTEGPEQKNSTTEEQYFEQEKPVIESAPNTGKDITEDVSEYPETGKALIDNANGSGAELGTRKLEEGQEKIFFGAKEG